MCNSATASTTLFIYFWIFAEFLGTRLAFRPHFLTSPPTPLFHDCRQPMAPNLNCGAFPTFTGIQPPSGGGQA